MNESRLLAQGTKKAVLTLLAAVLVGFTCEFAHASLRCDTDSYSTAAGTDGAITLNENGEVEFWGNKLINYFRPELNASKAKCVNNGGPGFSVESCVFSANVRLAHLMFSNEAMIGFPASTGFSRAGYGGFILFDSPRRDKNWFFNNCKSL